MKLREEFNAEYAAGLRDAAALLKRHVADLIAAARDDAKRRGPLPFDDYIRLHENFLWPNQLLRAAEDLAAGKSLAEAFARVSQRYREPDPAQALGRFEDFAVSDNARDNGRLAAFEHLGKVLDVATRDFEMSTPAPGFRQLSYWHRRQPDAPYARDPATLAHAWQQRRQQAMATSVDRLRRLLVEGQRRPHI